MGRELVHEAIAMCVLAWHWACAADFRKHPAEKVGALYFTQSPYLLG
jgi:hypothetical protein